MSAINDRLKKLRNKMAESLVDVCIIPSSDCHNSESVSDYFKVRTFFSGFTGSAGVLIVSLENAYLFTDSRYFIQAEMELEGSDICLMRQGLPKTPQIHDFIASIIPEGGRIGFDGEVCSLAFIRKIEDSSQSKKVILNCEFKPSDGIWDDRPLLEFRPVTRLDINFVGESTESKLKRIREKLEEMNSDCYIISELDDIAWIMNLRGSDVQYNPLFFSYMIITDKAAYLYANIQQDKGDEIKEYIASCGVYLQSYQNFYEDGIKRVNNGTLKGVYINPGGVNYKISAKISSKLTLIQKPSIVSYMKCIKNEKEIMGIKRANIKDGVALIRFERRFRELLKRKEELTELSVQKLLYDIREEGEDYAGPSFSTICAFADHGAIVHYSSSKESNVKIREGSFLLIDSGGQYLDGTTDITRTYAIGEVPDKLKRDYTMVLKAMLKLMFFTFEKGCRGNQLDIVVKDIFWKRGMNFGHGTGHGIGSFLCCHEMPVNISSRSNPQTSVIFEKGMLTSDEPGVYITGEYGIRIENDLLCVEKFTNEYGSFLGFEPMTLCPIDTTCIYIKDMSEEDISNLNKYHQLVYEGLAPHLSGEDLEYLKESTRPLFC